MASPPLVLCYSFSTPPISAEVFYGLVRSYENDFTLLDQVELQDLNEQQRHRVKGILCTAGFAQSKLKLGREMMDLLPNLKVISTPSTGVNHIDVEAATARGIRVGHTPGHFLCDSVAEFAIGLLLASARSILIADNATGTADISRLDCFKFIPHNQQATGSTLGIVGMGNIGRALAEKARGFKMNILYHSRNRKEMHLEKHLGLTFCPDLKKLLQESDFVVLCLPLTEETTHLISYKELSLMKPTAHLINVGHGGTVNHDDLTAALQNGIIRGVALDVTEPDRLPKDHPLFKMSNVIITPHVAALTNTTIRKMWSVSLDNLKVGIKGEHLLYSVN